MSFLVLGEALIDSMSNPAGQVTKAAGGSPMNVAVGLGRLAQTVTLATQLGSDLDGDLIRQHLLQNGVSLLAEPAPATSVATSEITADGSARYEFHITWDPSSSLAQAEALLPLSLAVHTGSIAAHMQPGSQAVYDLFRQARSRALTSYDPNCRPTILGTARQVRREAELFAASSDVVKASLEDIEWLYPHDGYKAVADLWLSLGAAMVVITRGADGVWCRTSSGQAIDVPSAQVNVVDTVGAGDSFMSALLFGLAESGAVGAAATQRIQSMGRGELMGIIRQAIRAASITCTRTGANPPTLEEILALQPMGLHLA